MSVEATLERIETGRIIAILRGAFGPVDGLLASVLAEAGVTALEVTVDSPDAFARIERLARDANHSLAIGAGTVRTVEDVMRAADAGASFVVSPNRNIAVITAAARRGLVAIPGCLTPSEIMEALDAGAQAIKLFPAQVLTPDFVRAVRAPLQDVRLVPTGGITSGTVGAWRAAGAWAFGIGSELVGRAVGGEDALDGQAVRIRVGALARSFVEAAR